MVSAHEPKKLYKLHITDGRCIAMSDGALRMNTISALVRYFAMTLAVDCSDVVAGNSVRVHWSLTPDCDGVRAYHLMGWLAYTAAHHHVVHGHAHV